MAKHFNHDYDGGAPDVPLSVGDRFYGQDRGMDFEFLRDKIGQVIEDLLEDQALKVSGGLVIQGTGDTLTISPCVGYAKFSIDEPGDFGAALPPAVAARDVVARVESTQQTDMAISSATLDGVTVNYVKLRYVETTVYSRSRAKKAGSYAYAVEPDFEFVVDSTAPGTYDILLATFVGAVAGTFAIDNLGARNINSQNEQIVTIEDSVSENDIVVANWDRKKYKKADTTWTQKLTEVVIPGTDPVPHNWTRLTETKWLVSYFDTPNLFIVAFEFDEDGTPTFGTPVTYTVTGSFPSAGNLIALTATKAVKINGDASPGTTAMYGRVIDVSGLVVSIGSENTLYTARNGNNVQSCRKNSTHFVIKEEINASPPRQPTGSAWLVSGTTITQAGTFQSLGAVKFAFRIQSYRDDAIAVTTTYDADVRGDFQVWGCDNSGVWTQLTSTILGGVDQVNYGAQDLERLTPLVFVGGVNTSFKVAPQGFFASMDSNDYPMIDINLNQVFGVNPLASLSIGWGVQYNSGYHLERPFGVNNQLNMWVVDGNRQRIGKAIEFDEALIIQDGTMTMVSRDSGWMGNDVSVRSILSFELAPHFRGIATHAASAGGLLTMQFSGVKGGFSGLTPDADYYLTAAGVLATSGLVKVGKALSATEILIQPEDPTGLD